MAVEVVCLHRLLGWLCHKRHGSRSARSLYLEFSLYKEFCMSMLLLSFAPVLAAGLSSLVVWALIFFVISLIAYVFGARGVAGMSAGVGRTLLFVFLILAIVFAIVGLINAA
jgi:uncharacterized membrane protein YtjA (UPF0391 family)